MIYLIPIIWRYILLHVQLSIYFGLSSYDLFSADFCSGSISVTRPHSRQLLPTGHTVHIQRSYSMYMPYSTHTGHTVHIEVIQYTQRPYSTHRGHTVHGRGHKVNIEVIQYTVEVIKYTVEVIQQTAEVIKWTSRGHTVHKQRKYCKRERSKVVPYYMFPHLFRITPKLSFVTSTNVRIPAKFLSLLQSAVCVLEANVHKGSKDGLVYLFKYTNRRLR